MALVEIENIRKNFGALEVLKGIDLTIEQGEIVTIIGQSGSGKSTLLRCINALEETSGGEIRIGGQRMAMDMPNLREMRQTVGIVFQCVQPLSPHDHRAQRDAGPGADRQDHQGRGPRAGRRGAVARRPRRQAQGLSRPAVRRAAAARRDCPLPCHAPAADAVRRGDLGA
ncbi:ATP-binding cassette domain-containing protein [Ponticoccus litoralis]|uniref:ATP-binding cassette domain-containing protein n=1 Tax=Ponticoccus litoralis TaxID=422297 RepID=UPI003D2F0C6C